MDTKTLTWKRGSIPAHIGTGKITTYATTLSSGTEIEVRSIEGSFFFYTNGTATGGWVDSLKDAKAAIQRVEDQIRAIA